MGAQAACDWAGSLAGASRPGPVVRVGHDLDDGSRGPSGSATGCMAKRELSVSRRWAVVAGRLQATQALPDPSLPPARDARMPRCDVCADVVDAAGERAEPRPHLARRPLE